MNQCQPCWRLFPLGCEGSGSCSWATADLALGGWQPRFLSCWDWDAAGPFRGSQDCCDAARAALCSPTSRKGVDSWRTWHLPAHVERRSIFYTGRNTVSGSQDGCLFSYLVQHFCVLWKTAKMRDLLPQVVEYYCVSCRQSRLDSHWL